MAAKNMKELEAMIMKHVKDSLQKDVSKKVIQIAQEHVVEDVYDEYTPKVYDRTGGLVNSFEVKEIADGIEIENTRKDGNRNIAEVIEYGHRESSQGYEYVSYDPNATYMQPRPFIANTRREIATSNIHVEELKKSLNKKGIKTK